MEAELFCCPVKNYCCFLICRSTFSCRIPASAKLVFLYLPVFEKGEFKVKRFAGAFRGREILLCKGRCRST